VNSDIQGRASRFGARPSISPWHLSSEQPQHKVQNDGQHNADYDTRRYREEQPQVSLLQEYVAGQFPQERYSLPEDE
jgi:hypothetical protein